MFHGVYKSLRIQEMENIQKQIRQTYYKAYKDALEEQLNNNNFNWVCKLHDEIVIRICSMVPKRTDIHNRIAENMDPILFRQMLENNCYEPKNFVALIEYVYGWIGKLCAPARDEEVARSKKQLYTMMEQGATFGKLVPMFIFSVHEHLDAMDEDMNRQTTKNFIKAIKK